MLVKVVEHVAQMLASHNASNNANAVVYLPVVSVSVQAVIIVETYSESSCPTLDIAAEAIEIGDENVRSAENRGDGRAGE